jgi:hypothetical protein
MAEPRELQTVVDAAEQAAAAGDYASAEQFLREAAVLQEARLGPFHPDLANTLNNLGVVCDITDKPADAERCYRRAYAIATATLEPDHPFVATSRRNLRDFCAARGKPVELPAPPRVGAPEPELRVTRSVNLLRERPSDAASRQSGFVRSARAVAIAALGAGLVFVMFSVTRPWFGPDRQAGISPEGATPSLPVSPASTPEPSPVEPIIVPDRNATSTSGTAGVEERRASAASAPASPLTVASAQLCRDLSTSGSRALPGDWECHRPSQPVEPGSLFFYTRVKSPGDTTVQHHWYRGNQLRKVVTLHIRANPTDGYRTYSRNPVDHQNAGDWRVELRTRDGILLHRERFVVR